MNAPTVCWSILALLVLLALLVRIPLACKAKQRTKERTFPKGHWVPLEGSPHWNLTLAWTWHAAVGLDRLHPTLLLLVLSQVMAGEVTASIPFTVLANKTRNPWHREELILNLQIASKVQTLNLLSARQNSPALSSRWYLLPEVKLLYSLRGLWSKNLKSAVSKALCSEPIKPWKLPPSGRFPFQRSLIWGPGKAALSGDHPYLAGKQSQPLKC